ncbi:MAG: polysaccharide deacetylase family protein [Chloroflexi bacterium]|nr:polysaccharide deacetylase family protein [Chloroflexota bacterium]
MRRTKSTFLLLSVLSAAAAAGFFFKARLFSRLLEEQTSDEVLFRADPHDKVIALTIDDGPHDELTPEILDALAELQVPATFFIIGSQVPGNEAVMRRIVAEGHELGNHLMSDQRSITLDAGEFDRQLAETHALIAPFGPVRWFRPGSGFYNTRMLEQIRPYRYRCVVGSIYPYDAQFHSVEFATGYILGNVQPGSIIVLHDGCCDREGTVEVLRRVVPALKKRGYRFATLSDLTAL